MSSKNNPRDSQIYEEWVRARMAERLTNENLVKIERAFGYSFKNKNLLRQAFLYLRFRPNNMGLLNKCRFEECLKNKDALVDLTSRLKDFSYDFGGTKWMK